MAKQMKIIGSCPFCQREVGSDMRPINELNMKHIKVLASQLKITESSNSSESVVSICSEQQANSKSTVDENKEEKNPASDLTEAVLDMVKEQFESVPDSESTIPEDNAELIMAMLTEEHHTYNKYLSKRNAMTKRRK